MKFNKEKAKQIIMISISFFLIMFGYFNFRLSNKDNTYISSRANETNLGDVELVSSVPIDDEGKIEDIVPNDDIQTNNEVKELNNYFEETKIERDKMYSQMLETYQKIVDSDTVSSEQKAVAMQEITNLTNTKNGIMISENLIKNKGFENVVIMVNSGNVNVVVKYPKLSKEQVSQIQNIIEREFNVNANDVNISVK